MTVTSSACPARMMFSFTPAGSEFPVYTTINDFQQSAVVVGGPAVSINAFGNSEPGKPASLTPHEYATVKTHCNIGQHIVQPLSDVEWSSLRACSDTEFRVKQIMEKGRGSQFDPHVLDALLRRIEDVTAIMTRESDAAETDAPSST